jgi:FAD/FMN-containing dehydrogenase
MLHIGGWRPGVPSEASAAIPDPRTPGIVVNDVHSQLNRTRVAEVADVTSVANLQRLVRQTAAAGGKVSIAGGRHSMGGQQFGAGTVLLDMRTMDRVLDLDRERGLVTVEAGIDWPRLIDHLLWASAGDPRAWSIIQKQTGADRLTIGGALAANVHGRGLRMPPIVADVEAFDLVDHTGALVRCSRTENASLFGLAVGGYGLFGAIARVTLRLRRRHTVERRVSIASVDKLPSLFERRIADGYEYGDFQFATDAASSEFLRTGVFSCYRQVDADGAGTCEHRRLTRGDWRRLILLAHTDKSRAFAEYARHYMSTDGQIYWSDTHQLGEYIDEYHEALDRQVGIASKGSEMITELYVKRADLPAFMTAVREDARRYDMNIIYGTIRLIERDTETVLAWAREPWACIAINLHVDHTPAGIAKASADFRRLIDIAVEFGGTYYLTYHRFATREQVERCHPHIREFLRLKREMDPDELFVSDWYAHHVRLLEGRKVGQ